MHKRFQRILLSLALQLSLGTGVAAAQGPVFDTHVHLHDGETSLTRYQAEAAAAGIELAGIAAMWFGGPHQALAGDPAAIRAGNDGAMASARRHPGTLAVATVHPYDGEAALAELTRVAAAGVKVLKVHPHTQRFAADDPRVLALVRKAGELGMVVLMDNASIVPEDSVRLFNLALQAPRTRFIFAHMGATGFRFWNTLALVRTADRFFMDNIWFDISATVVLVADSPVEPEFVWTLRNVGIDRVLLGSDYPQFSLRRTVDALERLDLTDEEKARIRSRNALALFGQ